MMAIGSGILFEIGYL